MRYDVAIIGAGVVGAMAARELSRYDLKVCLLEKENDVAMGASRANSGIIHGGYDPIPGTMKAKMNTAGVPLLYEAARELNVHYQNNGSFVCAFGEDENPAIDALYARGLENNIEQLQILTGDEARAMEPNLSEKVTRVLYIPTAGIICPYNLTIAATGNAMDNGVELLGQQGLALNAKENWNGCRENTRAFREMTDEEKDAFIKENPAYGKIVCRCETISEGEIRAAIHRNPPAFDIDAVKRRTRSGMGRCQGGFCSPYVMRLIAEEQGMNMEDVTKSCPGSKPLTGKL